MFATMISQTLRGGLLAAAITLLLPYVASAGDAAWITDNDGDWGDAFNWTVGGPPNGVGEIANLNFDLTADRVITLSDDQTLRVLNVSDPASDYFSYTISGTGKLIFTGGAEINKTQDVSIIDLTGPNPNNGLNPNTAHDVIAVPIELQSNITIRNNANNLTGALEFSEGIGNDGTNRNVTVRGPNLGGDTPNNQGGRALVVFSTANSYGGTTTLNNGARLLITHSDALGTGNIAQIAGGGSTNSVSSLELAGGITVNNHITTLSGTDLRLDAVGRIENVSGHNTFAGDILGIGTGGSNYPIHSHGTAEGDFFTFSGNIINSRNSTTPDAAPRNLIFGGGGDGEVTGDIYETGNSTWSVTKNGTGAWTLSGENTYQGPTTANAGKLLVNGTHTGGGDYTVTSNGTLGGLGTISATVTLNGTISPGSASTPGTLAVGGLTIHNGATGVFDLDPTDPGSAVADVLKVNGAANFNFDASTLNLVFSSAAFGGGAFSTPGSWLLVDADSLSGMPPTTINLTFVEGFSGVLPSLDIDVVNGDISLVLTAGLAGDFNSDGVVNAADYVVWRDGLGGTFQPEDYNTWVADFGNELIPGTGASFSVQVPEPSGYVLLFLSGLLFLGSSRKATPFRGR